MCGRFRLANRAREDMQGDRSTQRASKRRKKNKKKPKTALVICRDRKQLWTKQTQFWQCTAVSTRFGTRSNTSSAANFRHIQESDANPQSH